MELDEIGYALSKQVVDIEERGEVDLETSYGTLKLYGADARLIAAAARTILETRLKSAQRAVNKHSEVTRESGQKTRTPSKSAVRRYLQTKTEFGPQ